MGSILESVDDVLTNPKLLSGKTPAQVQAITGKTPGWKVETLGKGSKKGQGWVFRQYNDRGSQLVSHYASILVAGIIAQIYIGVLQATLSENRVLFDEHSRNFRFLFDANFKNLSGTSG